MDAPCNDGVGDVERDMLALSRASGDLQRKESLEQLLDVSFQFDVDAGEGKESIGHFPPPMI